MASPAAEAKSPLPSPSGPFLSNVELTNQLESVKKELRHEQALRKRIELERVSRGASPAIWKYMAGEPTARPSASPPGLGL